MTHGSDLLPDRPSRSGATRPGVSARHESTLRTVAALRESTHLDLGIEPQFTGADRLRHPLEDHRCLNAITTTKALATGSGRCDGVKPISKRRLSVERPLQLGEV